MKSCHILAIHHSRAAALLLALLHFLLTALHCVAQEPPDGKMHVTRSAPNTYTLSVATGSLWEYRIEATDDLAGTWMALDSVFLLGDGDVHSLRVVVPQGVRKSFFRYFIQPRAGAPLRP